MQWNWQQTDWPNWRYDAQPLEALEQQFLVGAGRLLGAWDHLVQAKTKLFDRLRGELNPRQAKALQRVFAAGPEGFVGGLSASNYQAITKASSATARRDLVDLVAKGALRRTGQHKGTRYWLSV